MYPDEVLAGLVQAATVLADEQNRSSSSLGKRKRDENDTQPTQLADNSQSSDVHDPGDGSNQPQLQNSASILFREPSAKSRKYSRPPLGKVFNSLQLAPENFLRLQNAAKAFMLDEAHPERREVVGHKKHMGGADVAKLNLWRCVEDFLAGHGYGAKYFGPGVGNDIPGAPKRTILWPQDGQVIVKLMMPLMRKMVTNERQRVYAATSRKGGTVPTDHTSNSPIGVDGSTLLTENGLSPTPVPTTAAVPDAAAAIPAEVLTQSPSEAPPPNTVFKQSTVLYVNVVSNTGGALRREVPRFTLTPESAPSLAALIAEVDKRYKRPADPDISTQQKQPIVKVWLTDGLVTVAEDGEWMVALLSAGVVDWMDGEIRVLVEV
ncbi:uncharacterized protein A1O9_04364 [Exophiala aquamarina CBS 119918]|uniref:Uncharacterized protein n=1 Tax=Exophiala aquamarina CBS 119918 TaxID=1182545 RepID=A0A072PVB6_9EURO|nr:uncharacterized protein A1O9_04364 [Exophiala aquamarina CBS 119918]KEF59520.1 hypothetical protein A1O9_04364 [Exophiala aquamarina CBS 119918]